MPISSHRSVVFPPERAFSVKYSRPYLPASFVTSLRSAWRSSDSLKLLVISVSSTTASTSPAATCAPGFTSISVTVPGAGGPDGVLHLHRLEDEHRLAGLDLLALLDRDADDGAGHRRQQAAAGDRVGRVDEPRRTPQRHVPAGPVDVDRVADDGHVVRRTDAVRLERRTLVELVETTAASSTT